MTMTKGQMLAKFAETAKVTAMGDVILDVALERGDEELARQTRDAIAALVVGLLELTLMLRETGATDAEFRAALDAAEAQFAAECAGVN